MCVVRQTSAEKKGREAAEAKRARLKAKLVAQREAGVELERVLNNEREAHRKTGQAMTEISAREEDNVRTPTRGLLIGAWFRLQPLREVVCPTRCAPSASSLTSARRGRASRPSATRWSHNLFSFP